MQTIEQPDDSFSHEGCHLGSLVENDSKKSCEIIIIITIIIINIYMLHIYISMVLISLDSNI